METVRFEVADRVATITLNRPERKNAMNQQMKDELRACWQRVKAEPDVWAAIVTGAGEAFSSGADVESLATGGFARTDRWHELAMIEGIRELPTPRRQLVHKPVSAAASSRPWWSATRRSRCGERRWASSRASGSPSRRPRRSPPATSRWSSRARTTPRGRAPSSRSARPAGRHVRGPVSLAEVAEPAGQCPAAEAGSLWRAQGRPSHPGGPPEGQGEKRRPTGETGGWGGGGERRGWHLPRAAA